MSSIYRRFYTELCQTLFRQPNILTAAEPLIQRVFPWFSAGFYAARVLQIKPQAGCLRLTLKVSRFFPLFTPGQHLQLRVSIRGVPMERTFSICSPVQQLHAKREIELAVKIQPQGRFTSALSSELTLSSYVHLGAPTGDFSLSQDHAACLVAAGSGVTPLFSMLNSLSRLTVPLLFVYSYRGATQLLFAEHWAELQAKFPLLQLILWDSAVMGRLTPERLFAKLQPKLRGKFLLCGPTEFTQDFRAACLAQGVSPTQISIESFGLLQRTAASSQPVRLALGQQQHVLGGQGSILQRAEQSGLVLRYGCRRGVCMQCLCDKSSGVVRNLLTGELSDAGAGRIQLCISEAVSPVELSSEGLIV
ncbi:MAG: FAD-binding oxidoreductase [Rheinheimera sp.]|nr:FAD-binding oxidoreductase [Rheinheimera sp.]